MKRVWNPHLDNLLRRHYPKGDIKALADRTTSATSRNKSIRRDKIRLHWGLEPLGKLVKRW